LNKLTLLLAASACLIAVPVAIAEPAWAQLPGSRTLTAQDLFSLEQATDPQVRPGGKQVVYVRASNDINADRARRSIWIVDAATGAQSPLVTGPGNHMSPRWSPDGKRLAYVSTAEGGAQLFVRWMDTGATARVAVLPEGPDSIAWSPDGRSIAFLMFTGGGGGQTGGSDLGRAAEDHRGPEVQDRQRRHPEARRRPDLCGLGRRRGAASADQRRFRQPGPAQLEPGRLEDPVLQRPGGRLGT
jgi:dipeptidyl aminopeptidase/acylaminoacyl peptidase